MLKLERITKRFDGAIALDDVNLSVPSGKVHALIGSSASGKTT
jgi:putrescine transport system ATP-binding protein